MSQAGMNYTLAASHPCAILCCPWLSGWFSMECNSYLTHLIFL